MVDDGCVELLFAVSDVAGDVGLHGVEIGGVGERAHGDACQGSEPGQVHRFNW
jgi:hypothetical protein